MLALLALAAALLVGLPTAAHACSCADLTPALAVREADAVFTGTVTNVREEDRPGRPRVYTFLADQVYKGTPAARITLTSNADSASCGYPFQRDGRYLVFAAVSSSGPAVEGVELSSGMCSGNVPVDRGTGPLRPGDERKAGHESLAGPVDAEFVQALGTPQPPAAAVETGTAGPLRADGDAVAERGAAGAGDVWGWAAGGAGVVLLVGALTAMALRRRGSAAGRR
ncbi:hypothetical protein HCN51_01965 [Nonomuraea sp. FMUSA5-5]|uniref:Tissue inhibitor of metalloproteinase n=1 Tax=Nonomuraea composti TaxID=2720023 RepID=A0ABX1AZ50_9ACTN|nr:hypothetical protein [Nonomuraea sp. FMUSA5-5]NJP88233.1 hypothetical protein [Nonomuraea sp. FMUSA5-5]